MESICVPLSWPPLVESTGDVRAEFEFVGLSGHCEESGHGKAEENSCC